MSGFAKSYFDQLQQVIGEIDLRAVEEAAKMMWGAYRKGRIIFFMGNGGSASTATHLAADIGKNTTVNHKNNREKRISTLALTDNPAWIMAVGNDLSFEDIFVEQLKNLGQAGDVVVAISGSGNSGNVVKAVKWAKKNKLKVIGLVGFDGGAIGRLADVRVWVRAKHYGYVEGVHSEIHHYWVEVLKKWKQEE